MSYTYSRTTRQYDGINAGKEYTFAYDRPHDLALNVLHDFNEKLSLGISWVYQTGLPYTPAIGRQYTPALDRWADANQGYYEAMVYGEKYSARMKDYHRLDVALNYHKTNKKGRRVTWTFSVYNLYNRRNPYFYYFNHNSSGEIYKPYQWDQYHPVSLYQISFFPVIPTVSYKVYFDGNREKPEKQSGTFKEKFIEWLYFEN